MIVITYILSHQKKTAEADEAEIGHFKDSSCSNQPGTCDIDDAMMLSPLELRIMMGDHPLHMVSPHVEYQPGFP